MNMKNEKKFVTQSVKIFGALAIVLALCMGVSGLEESDNPTNGFLSWGPINVSAPEIFLNASGDGSDHFNAIDSNPDMLAFGHGNVTLSVRNQSRLVSVWAGPNIYPLPYENVNISVGKDGSYVYLGFGEYANFSMGISPEWNQTLEIYVQSKEPIWCTFEIWGKIVAGSVCRNGTWEIDNPEQEDQYVLLGNVTMKNQIIVDTSGCGQGTYNLGEILTRIWLEPAARQTEVFVGTDEVGVSVWEGQKQDCWLEQKRLDISVETDSEEDFDVCGCFLLENGATFNTSICHVNVTAVREEHRGVEGKTWG